MAGSKANNDHLAEQLRNLVQEDAQRQQAKIHQQSSQQRADRFVCDNAREEYGKLSRLLKQRAGEMNSTIGDSPKFVTSANHIQLGNTTLYYDFDQPVVNRPDNELILTIGPVPNRMPWAWATPAAEPVKYKLYAAASNDFSSIVWIRNQRQFTTVELVDDVLQELARYHFKHKRN